MCSNKTYRKVHLLSKNLMIEIYKTIILPVVLYMGVKLGLSHQGRSRD
jgi:hypothetical protein